MAVVNGLGTLDPGGAGGVAIEISLTVTFTAPAVAKPAPTPTPSPAPPAAELPNTASARPSSGDEPLRMLALVLVFAGVLTLTRTRRA